MLRKLRPRSLTLQDTILLSLIKLGFGPWLTQSMLIGIRCRALLTTTRNGAQHWPFFGKPINSISEGSTDAAEAEKDIVKDHEIGSPWYHWFDDGLAAYHTSNEYVRLKPAAPTDMIVSLINNKVSVWPHPDFAMWLCSYADAALYEWPQTAEITEGLPIPVWVKAITAIHLIDRALQSLPKGFSRNPFVQQLVMMRLGVNYPILEAMVQLPEAKVAQQQIRDRHERLYAKQTDFYKTYGITLQEYKNNRA